MGAVTPSQVTEHPEWVLVDVRPSRERLGELGFVPGSRSLPMDSWDGAALDAALPFVGQPPTVVLFCATGKRSGRLMDEALESDRPIRHLEGGVLGWSGAGLPTALSSCVELLDEDDLAIADTLELQRLLLACFVAEATELTLGGAPLPPVSPLALLDHCFESAGVARNETRPERFYAVVDAASSLFRSHGGELERISANVTRMYTILRRLEST